MKLRFLSLWGIALGLSLVAGASTPAPRSEVITNGRFTLDDRPSILVVVDEKVVSFEKTRELMLDLFSNHSYQKITLCDVEGIDTIKDTSYEQIYCFGGGGALITKGGFDPIAWYFVLPTHEPPVVGPSILVGVALGKSHANDAINRSWQQWCKKAGMPWSYANVDTKGSVSHALNTLNDEIEKLIK
jgi:hypothetical protein